LDYLKKWISIFEQNKDILFYAYSKSLPFFNEVDILPNNFRVIFSFGGKYDHLINVNKHQHAKVFETNEDLLNAGYISAMENDLIAPKNKRVGLVFHSRMKFENSGFSKIK
jgi:hypothetical protein